MYCLFRIRCAHSCAGLLLFLLLGLIAPATILRAEAPGARGDLARALDQAAAGTALAGMETEGYATVRNERLAVYAAAQEHHANAPRRSNRDAQFQPLGPFQPGPGDDANAGCGIRVAAAASPFAADSLLASAAPASMRGERPLARRATVPTSARTWPSKGPGALYFAIRNGYAGSELSRTPTFPARHSPLPPRDSHLPRFFDLLSAVPGRSPASLSQFALHSGGIV